MKKLAYFFYYIFIIFLPKERFFKWSNPIRVWYMVNVLKIMKKGEHNWVEDHVYIASPGRVTMGHNVQIGDHVFIQAAEIGNYVMLAPWVTIMGNMHHFDRADIPIMIQGKDVGVKVVIEDDVWLGRNVFVMPGVRIGTGSIIGSGSVVTKDVAPYSIMGGNPARLIRSRK